MADLDTIAEVVVSARTEGVREATAATERLGQATDKLAAANDDLAMAQAAGATSIERQTRVKLSAASAADRLQKQLDAEYRAQKQMESALRDLERARQQGIISASREAELIQLAQQRYTGLAGAAREAGQATMAASKAQAQWAALSAQGSAQGGQFKETERLAAQFRAFSAQGAAQMQALQGLGTAAGEAAAANDNLGDKTEIVRHHLVNLGYQLSDVAASLGSGASPFTVLLQQGGQIAPILGETGVAGAVKGVGRAILGFLTPAVVTVGALTGAVAYGYSAWSRYDDEQRKVGTTLAGIGRQIGLSRSQFEDLSRSVAAASGLTTRQAADLGTALAATGKIGPENIKRIATVAKDFAATFGTDLELLPIRLDRMRRNRLRRGSFGRYLV